MASKQQAVIVDQFDEKNFLNHVHVVEKDVPQVQAGEVLVNPYLRPINPTDHMAVKYGYWGTLPAPAVIGSEGKVNMLARYSSAADMYHVLL